MFSCKAHIDRVCEVRYFSGDHVGGLESFVNLVAVLTLVPVYLLDDLALAAFGRAGVVVQFVAILDVNYVAINEENVRLFIIILIAEELTDLTN